MHAARSVRSCAVTPSSARTIGCCRNSNNDDRRGARRRGATVATISSASEALSTAEYDLLTICARVKTIKASVDGASRYRQLPLVPHDARRHDHLSTARYALARHTGLLLNGTMIVSTLPVGGHHLVDALAGAGLTLGAIFLVRR